MNAAPDVRKEHERYETMYRGSPEPWNYRRRGAELLRHERIAEELGRLAPRYGRALDIGCSLGQLTIHLAPLAEHLFAFDVSESAVRRTRQQLGSGGLHCAVAALPGLPFRSGGFDLIVAADAIHEFVPEPQRARAVREIFQALRPGGVALFTDYMQHQRFPGFLELVAGNGFAVERVVPLYDRCWYQFESWFKAVRHWTWVGGLLASIGVARALRWPARALGRAGSRHILILARKPEEKSLKGGRKP